MPALAGFPVSADAAAQHAATEQRRMNNGRTIPTIPTQIQKLAAETCVWIYNVSPFPFKKELGSAGTYFIPACPPGESYSIMRPVPGVFSELVIRDETAFEVRYEDGAAPNGGSSGGQYIAEQILGVGMHLPPQEALTKWGCFIGSQVGPNAKPTKAELAAASAQLDRTAHEYANEADLAYRTGPKEAEATIGDLHHWAAGWLKLNTKEHLWMRGNLAATLKAQTCPVDGTTVEAGVVLCPTCRYIFDEARYKELQGRMAK